LYEQNDSRSTSSSQRSAQSDQSGAPEESRQLALAVAEAGLSKKARHIEIINVHGKVDYTDMLVVMSGGSDRHVHAIAKAVEALLRERLNVVPLSVEGLTAATWVLLDFNDVVVHVFQQETRSFYDLEGLWIDASRVALPESLVSLPSGSARI